MKPHIFYTRGQWGVVWHRMYVFATLAEAFDYAKTVRPA